jgi:adenylate cyclase
MQSPSTEGLKLDINTGGISKAIKDMLPFHLIFAALIFGLFQMGGYRIIAMRFEFPFAIKFLFFLLLLFTSFYHYFLNQRRIWQTFLKNNFTKNSQLQMQDIEYGLHHYMSELSEKISLSFKNADIFSDPIWNKVFDGVLFDRQKKVSFSRNDLGEIVKLALLGGAIVAIQQQPEYSGSRKISDIENSYQVEEIRRNFAIPDFLRSKLTEKILASSKSSFFTESGRAKFVTWQATDEGFLFFWDKRGQNENFELMVASTYTLNLQKMYLEDLSKTKNDEINYIALEQRNPQYTLNTANFLTKKELEHIRNLYEQRTGIPFQFHRDNRNYSAVFLQGNAFRSFNFLFIIPDQILYEPLQEFERNFLLFCLVYWSCGISCIFYILKIILQPLSLLKEGLQQINSGESGVMLPVCSADEGGELIRQFNFMSTEMAKTEKMLPYVPESLYALLDQNSELQSDKPWFQGEAAIIFSDIRSFTTISESCDPELVVRVLNEYFSIWQQKVEKYSGIIDRFIGDAIIIAFFAQNSKHWLQNSVQTALEVLEELELFNRKNSEKIGFSVNIGVGITAGDIEIGIIKSRQKTELLMTGKVVQQAEKLESDSKNGKFSHILVSEKIHTKTRFVFDYEKFADPTEKIYEIKN